jgi:hypothetical protein
VFSLVKIHLLEYFGHRIIYDSGFPLQSKLEVVIKNGEWFWPLARSDALVEVQSKLHEIELGVADLAVLNAKNGQYNCADTWEKLREVHSVVDGGNWSGSQPQSLGIPSFSGLCSGMHWSLSKECVDGVILDIPCVYSAMVPKRAVNTSSLGVVLVAKFGLKSWLNVPFWMLLWIVMLLKIGVWRFYMAEVFGLVWGGCVWGLSFIIYGNRRMLFCITLPLEQKNPLWFVLDGEFVQGWWLKDNSRISIMD